MKIITFEDIRKLNIDTNKCYEWVSHVIKHKKEMILPPKISLKPNIEGVFYNTMPTIIPDDNIAGLKLVTRYPQRTPSLVSKILLCDLQTGNELALLDGTWITAMRTGCVAAHSINLLAKKDWNTLSIMGCGNISRSTMNAVLATNPNRKMKVKLYKFGNEAELFVKRFSLAKNVNFIICDTYEETIKDSDVIISAVTVFENDIIENTDLFKKGVLLVPIHTRGFSNCDLVFDKIYGDDTGHVCHFKYFDQYKHFAEISDIVNGLDTGRENDNERIIAYNIGLAVHDLYFARKIYDLSTDALEVDYKDPKDKFWM